MSETRLWRCFGGLVAAAVFLIWLNRTHPAAFPPWAPWDFSWPVFLGTFGTLAAYGRGLSLAEPTARPPAWRIFSFIAGVLSLYAVLQTRIDYYAQHEFFLHRAQHAVLHHLGPFLIGLGDADAILAAGLPALLARPLLSSPAKRLLAALQQPVVASTLFFGLIYLWLIPPLHFRAMLDWRLYNVMNWSMAIDGILFWSLVLDPRPGGASSAGGDGRTARVSFGARVLMVIAVIPPQIAIGAFLTYCDRELFPVYTLCGRVLELSPVVDQQFGGMILWHGPLMAIPALFVILRAIRASEESPPSPSPS
jgi:putative membrane protein